jgi:undecaprenyl-diphosphatase
MPAARDPVSEGTTEATAEVLDPTAPGASALPVDLPEVVPEHEPSRRRELWVVVGCGCALALLTAAVVRDSEALAETDLALHGFALAHRGPLDSALALTVTWAGATYVALPVLLVVGCLAPPGPRSLRSRLGAGLLLAGTASVGIYAGLLLNHVVDRTRPPAEDWWGAAGGPAFPSGHTTVATIVAIEIAWALSAWWSDRTRRRLVWGAAAVVAVAVGWSRVWLGVHWPGDVLGGWLFGTAWAVGAALLLSRARTWRVAR